MSCRSQCFLTEGIQGENAVRIHCIDQSEDFVMQLENREGHEELYRSCGVRTPRQLQTVADGVYVMKEFFDFWSM